MTKLGNLKDPYISLKKVLTRNKNESYFLNDRINFQFNCTISTVDQVSYPSSIALLKNKLLLSGQLCK